MALILIEPYIVDTTGNFTFNDVTATGNLSSLNANLGNTATANFFIGSGNNLSNIQGANVTGQASNALIAGTVYTNAQPNITSVGTLTGLTSNGIVNFSNTSNTSLGAVGNVHITGGSSGQYLQTDGSGTLTWATVAGGSSSNISNGNSNVNIPSANGNINFSAVGNTVMVITGTGVNVAGTLNTGSGIITGNGNGLSSLVGANVTGQVANSLIAGTVYTNAQPNITSVGTLTSLTVTGNVTGGNLVTAGKVYSSDFINGGTGIYLSAGPSGYINFFTTGGDKASISDTGNIIASNLIANSTVFATTANISGNVTAGNANLGNSVTANYFTGTLTTSAQPNITSVGTLTDLSVSGNGVFGGNLTVNGTLTYINSTTLAISDPIINLQTGPNGAAPVANSGKDVGTALNYYDTSAKISWMGWDVSNAEIAFGANVGISSEVVTFTELANIRSGNAQLGNTVTANYFIGSGNNLSNIAGANVTGQVGNALVSGTVYTNAQPNITSVGTLSSLAVTGNTTSGNANLGNTVTANYFIGSGNNLSNIAGANVTGQVGNALVAGTVYTNAQPNITSVGSLTGLIVSNATGVVDFTTTANVTLGAVANLHISGGTIDYVLRTDGSGNLSWVAQSGGGGSPGGINTQVQFNDAGNFGGNTGFTFNKTTTTLTANNFVATSTANLGSNANVIITGGTNGYVLSTNGSGALSWVAQSGGGSSNISNGNSNVNIPTANGNINFSAVGNANVVVITGTGANISGTADVTGNLSAGNIVTGGGTGGSITGANVIAANTLTASSNITTPQFISNVSTGTAPLIVTSTTQVANLSVATAGTATTAGTVTTNAQPNITSVGTLSSLTVTANITGGNLIGPHANGNSNVNIPSANGNINLTAVGNTIMVITGTGINAAGTLNVTGNANVGNLGTAQLLASANITAPQLISNVSTGTAPFVVTSTTQVANLNVATAGLATFATTANAVAGANVSGAVAFATTANAVAGANVSGQVSNALIAGTVYTNAQPNITSLGSLTGLTVSNATGVVDFTTTANVTLGAVANLHISGGTGGYVLSTDGSGTLSWVAQSGGGASISNGNSNVNIPSANGNINFTAVSNTVMVITGTGANISGTANITGNLVAGNANLGNAVIANYFIGSGNNLSNIQGSNVTGAVSSATTATTAGTVTTAAQPNITSVGTLTTLDVNGTVTAAAFTANTGVFTGNGNGLSSIVGANVTGQVGNALVAGTVYTNAQPNITSVGSLTGLTVSNATGVVNFITTANVSLGAVGNLKITGGTVDYVLRTDGAGNLSWVAQSGGGGSSSNISNGNSNVNIPSANGNINFTAVGNTTVVISGTGINVAGTLNTGTGNANVGNLGTAGLIIATGNITGGNINTAGKVVASTLESNVTTGTAPLVVASTTRVSNLNVAYANVTDFINVTTATTGTYYPIFANAVTGNVEELANTNLSYNVATSGLSATLFTGTLTTAAQPNITSTGSLTGLTVSNATGVVDFTTTANVTLGAVANLHISGGTVDYVLRTDGAGNLSWVAQSGGGGSSSNISNGNSNVNIPSANGNINFSAVGNANVVVITGTGANISGTLDVTGNATFGNLNSSGSGGNISNANVISANTFIATGINISAGNISAGNFVGLFANGTSNISIPVANGNISISAGGTPNEVVITSTGVNVSGYLNATGNLTVGNLSVTGGIIPRVVVIADATSVTINGDTTDIATQTNTQAVGTLTINAPTGTPFNGQKIMFRLQSTNVQTFSWNGIFQGSTDIALPTTSSGAGKYDYTGFIYNTTAVKWQLIAKNFGF